MSLFSLPVAVALLSSLAALLGVPLATPVVSALATLQSATASRVRPATHPSGTLSFLVRLPTLESGAVLGLITALALLLTLLLPASLLTLLPLLATPPLLLPSLRALLSAAAEVASLATALTGLLSLALLMLSARMAALLPGPVVLSAAVLVRHAAVLPTLLLFLVPTTVAALLSLLALSAALAGVSSLLALAGLPATLLLSGLAASLLSRLALLGPILLSDVLRNRMLGYQLVREIALLALLSALSMLLVASLPFVSVLVSIASGHSVKWNWSRYGSIRTYHDSSVASFACACKPPSSGFRARTPSEIVG